MYLIFIFYNFIYINCTLFFTNKRDSRLIYSQFTLILNRKRVKNVQQTNAQHKTSEQTNERSSSISQWWCIYTNIICCLSGFGYGWNRFSLFAWRNGCVVLVGVVLWCRWCWWCFLIAFLSFHFVVLLLLFFI